MGQGPCLAVLPACDTYELSYSFSNSYYKLHDYIYK